MRKLPLRTGATDLSQDELFLLDALFDGGAPICLLRRECFGTHWLSHPHDLDDSQLYAKLHAMCVQGLLKTVATSLGDGIVMTELGGELWSRERCPVWDRYLIDGYREIVSGKPSVSIVATTMAIADDMLRLGGPCGDWTLDTARVRRFKIRNHQLIPWRSFTDLYVLIAVNYVESSSFDFPDPAAYRQRLGECDQRRTWWRSVRELQKFLPTAG